MKKSRYLFAGIIGIGCLLFVCLTEKYCLLAHEGWGGYADILLGATTSTGYSKKYSERAFLKIRIGMQAKDVEKLLGAPLQKYIEEERMKEINLRIGLNLTIPDTKTEVWVYALPRGQSGYRIRDVLFRDGVVIQVKCQTAFFD